MEGLVFQDERGLVRVSQAPFGKTNEKGFVQSIELVAHDGMAHAQEGRTDLVRPARDQRGLDEAET
jgi:hypothetical protein